MEGDVALMNTVAIWSTIAYAFGATSWNDDPVLHDDVIASDADLVIGGLLSTKWKVSRGRTLIFDDDVGALGLLGLAGAMYYSSDWDKGAHMTPARFATGGSGQAMGIGAEVHF
jgi:hypothetical protein